MEFASKIASKSTLTLKTGKKAFYEQIDKDLSGAYEYASRVMVENMMARDAEEALTHSSKNASRAGAGNKPLHRILTIQGYHYWPFL